jgi:hypothetical protein
MQNPYDHYWLADDARVYASARQIITDDQDADYVAWTSNGHVAMPWPRDESGNQTDAAMQAVAAQYGQFVNLDYYAANARYRCENSGIQITSIGGAVPFGSDIISRNAVDTAWAYMNAKGTTNAITWKMSDGSFIQMTTAQVSTLMHDLTAFIQSCFDCEGATVAAIDGGSITTRQQVDDAFAAISNVFP